MSACAATASLARRPPVRVAAGRAQGPVPGRVLHRCSCGGKGGECEACRRRRLQRRARGGRGDVAAPPAVYGVIGSPGRPLDEAVRRDMESRFGHDFSRVRIHDDAAAAESAASVQAHAYTVGAHIVFGANQYAPVSGEGRCLLAHELTHVVQQAGGPAGGPIRIVAADHPSEREANRAARHVPGTIVQETAPARALHRYSHEDCTDADLRAHIWPADGIAKTQLAAAIAAASASPVTAATQALFTKYFMTSTPDTAAIRKVYGRIKKAFDGDDYTYECEDDCDAGTNAYSGWAWDIHVCMNNLRGRANDCIGRTIVHEFSHKYAGTDDEGRCYNGCNNAGCVATLSTSDALDNAYSYAGFAREA
ncbi:MAG: DUF4157 domain-containing protein [Gemmatimonadetes bacterium]|nr:DUF4157 domain-containing protein [Gemmatimonadota bacterium]